MPLWSLAVPSRPDTHYGFQGVNWELSEVRGGKMAGLQRRLSQPPGFPEEKHGKYRLDELNAFRVAKHLVIFRPDADAVAEVMTKARAAIPGLAATEDVLRVIRFNPDCFFAVSRRSRFDPHNPKGEGFIAMLPLNTIGLQLLAIDALNASSPNVKFLAKPGERAEAIYWWGVFAPGPLAAGMALFMQQLAEQQYAGLDIYARPVTPEGRNFLQVLGFSEGADIGKEHALHLWKFRRAAERPLYDSYVTGKGKREIGVTVARSFEDLMRVAAIRNAVYIGEQECPYDEEYDGNDLSATHLLAYIGDEPVGCLRLRFFAGFAKFERMAIRKEFRKSRAAIQLARAGFAFCQKKGYGRILGHVQEQLVPFWSRFGFRMKPDTKRFVFSDVEYVEIVALVEPDADAVTADADPYLLIRPEGRWDVPGILERSAERPLSPDTAARKVRPSRAAGRR